MPSCSVIRVSVGGEGLGVSDSGLRDCVAAMVLALLGRNGGPQALGDVVIAVETEVDED